MTPGPSIKQAEKMTHSFPFLGFVLPCGAGWSAGDRAMRPGLASNRAIYCPCFPIPSPRQALMNKGLGHERAGRERNPP
ncbi:MAG: hypothetical protein COB49_01885 [Alphaproteobacteria bacterium]|nr:MAG: hypothetical protein COB49_01885 [Alphaproteobacteria bacterium]